MNAVIVGSLITAFFRQWLPRHWSRAEHHVAGVIATARTELVRGKAGDRMAAGESPEAVDPSAAGAQDARPATGGITAGGARIRQPEKERRRYAWLYDDEDIWGTAGFGCVPAVIDGDDWRAPRV